MQNADSALDFSMDSLHLAWVNTVMLVPRRTRPAIVVRTITGEKKDQCKPHLFCGVQKNR